jgi:hypothetical protein
VSSRTALIACPGGSGRGGCLVRGQFGSLLESRIRTPFPPPGPGQGDRRRRPPFAGRPLARPVQAPILSPPLRRPDRLENAALVLDPAETSSQDCRSSNPHSSPPDDSWRRQEPLRIPLRQFAQRSGFGRGSAGSSSTTKTRSSLPCAFRFRFSQWLPGFSGGMSIDFLLYFSSSAPGHCISSVGRMYCLSKFPGLYYNYHNRNQDLETKCYTQR